VVGENGAIAPRESWAYSSIEPIFDEVVTRFDRARAFYAAGQRFAEASGVTFAWSCVTAPGVDHNDAKAAPFAVTLILESERDPGGPCRQGVAVE